MRPLCTHCIAARHAETTRGVKWLYAALLALTLMLGKIYVAQAEQAPGAATKPDAGTATVLTEPTAAVGARSNRATADNNSIVLSSAPLSAPEKYLLLGRDAFEKRDVKSLAIMRDRMSNAEGKAYVLSSYMQYWWLSANLAQTGVFAITNAGEISAFLKANPDSVVSDNLRREWLKLLGKQDRWDWFAPEVPLLNIEDAEIACHHWRYRLSRNDRDALVEAKSFWVAARAAPEACGDVFASLAAEKKLTPDEAWLRLRRLLENNQLADARRSAILVPQVPSTFERATAVVGQNPSHYLQREKLQPASRASIELFLFAVTRLARTDADQAATLLDAHGKKLSESDRGYAWAQVGLYGGVQHDQGALGWYERAANFPLNDTQAAWKVRAALRAGEWATVESAINAMSDTERRESAWRYWLARASQQAGKPVVARSLREVLARENNFYGVLAAEELGSPSTPSWQGWKPASADMGAVARRPAIARALALYRLDMKAEGLREWLYGIRSMSDQELLAAAEVARSANIPDRAINTAEKTLSVHDFSQRFPTPHHADLSVQARARGLDEAWVYGLIRQESRFMADARSRVGAMGLMQLMPATAKWAAMKVGPANFSLANVADVPTNLSLGAFYLRHVLDEVGHPVLATAGYNAGPGRARRWRASQALEGSIYAESIPFAETRDYVKKVMVNAWFYTHQAGATTRRLTDMVGTVPGSSQGSTGISTLASVALPPRAP